MPIIDFFPGEHKKKQATLANFLAKQERTDLADLFAVMEAQCQKSYLYRHIDFRAIFNSIEKQVNDKYYANRTSLSYEDEKRIIELYDDRFDVDEFYEKYLKK